MLGVLARNWWVLALRGALAILFGVLVVVWPEIGLPVIIALVGAYMLVDGVFSIVNGVRNRDTNRNWWVLLIEGVVGIIAGVLAFLWPGLTAVVLVFLVAGWAIVTGIFEILAAIRLREEIEGEIWLGLSGFASLIFGVLLVVIPAEAGILTLLWLVALYAVLFGVLMLILAFRLRGLHERGGVPPMSSARDNV